MKIWICSKKRDDLKKSSGADSENIEWDKNYNLVKLVCIPAFI